MDSDTTAQEKITLSSDSSYSTKQITIQEGTTDKLFPDEDTSDFQEYLYKNSNFVIYGDGIKELIKKFEKKYQIDSSKLNELIISGEIEDTYETSYWSALLDLVK